jgi:ribosome-associated protein YbcJ (S4-like RNA binding protein)
LDARSRSGSIEVVETDSIAIDRLEATRGAKVVAGDAITIVSLVTPEQAELIAKTVMTGENGSITAGRLLVDAQVNVSVKTTVGILDARSQTGSIEIVETDSIQIDRLEAARGAKVVAGDAITIVSLVTPEQAELIAKTVMTGENGSITADRLLVDAHVNVSVKTTVGILDARSQTGSIEIVETDSIQIDRLEAARGAKVVAGDAITIISLVTPEQAELIAKTVMTGENGSITADRLLVDAQDNVSVYTTVGILDARSQMGSIEVVETDSLRIDRLESALGAKVTAGDAITIVSLVTPRAAELRGRSVRSIETGSIQADRLTIAAEQDVDVRTAIAGLDARSSEGSVTVNETDSLRINRLEAALGATVTAVDAITIVSLVTPEQAELVAKSVMTGEGGSITAERLLIEARDNVSVTTTVGVLDARSQSGSIEVIESDSIIIDRMITNSVAKISSGGSIESGTDRISADQLTVVAQGAINLSTAIRRLDAKSQAGSIAVREIDSLEYVLMNTPGRAEIYAKSVMTGEGSSIAAGESVQLHAQFISIFGNICAEKITVNATQHLCIDDKAILTTQSGYVFGSFLNFKDESNSGDTRVIDQVQTQSLRDLPNRLRRAEIQVGLTDGQMLPPTGNVMASGLKVEFNWGEGAGNGSEKREYFNRPLVVQHTYFVHPNMSNPSENIVVQLRVSDLAKGTIELNENSRSVLADPKYQSSVTIPVISTLPVFAVPIPQPTTILVPQRPRLQVDSAPVISQSSIVLNIDRSINSSVQVTPRMKRTYLIAEVSPESERDDQRCAIPLENNKETDQDQTYDLKQLPELFKRLPDNRYQILLREDILPNQPGKQPIKSSDKIILDVIIKDGQARSVPFENVQDESDDR